jgi:hypothetical protein
MYVNYHLQKEDSNQACITIGGNLIDYLFELTTHTANLTLSKILWNSTISTPGARFLTVDIRNFYLETPMDHHDHMHMKIELFLQEIIDHYNLNYKVKGGYVYISIKKGM